MTTTSITLINYTCDICGKEVEYRSYIYHDDLPDGWVWYFEHGDYEGNERHACQKCKVHIKDGHRIS